MRFIYAWLFIILLAVPIFAHDEAGDDFSEFEDFEDFDADDVNVPAARSDGDQRTAQATTGGDSKSAGSHQSDFYEQDDADDDGIVGDEDDNEFEHFADEEEFEGFSQTESSPPTTDQKTGEPKLTMAKVPLHFR